MAGMAGAHKSLGLWKEAADWLYFFLGHKEQLSEITLKGSQDRTGFFSY